MGVQELGSVAEFDDFISGDTISVIKIGAKWCGSCQQAAPQFEELSNELDGKAVLGNIDVEVNKETSDDKERVGVVRMLPTFIICKDGKRVRSVGYFGDMHPIQAAVEALNEGSDGAPMPHHGRPHHPPFGFSRGGGGMGGPFGGMPPGMPPGFPPELMEGGMGPPGMFGGMEGMPPGMGLPPHMAMPNFDDVPDGRPAISPEAEGIVEEFAVDIEKFHEACAGQVSKIHHLLNSIAQSHNKPPLPPRAIGSIFEVEEGQRKSAAEGGTRISLEQMLTGFKKMVNDKEPKEKFEASVVEPMRKQSALLQNTRDIMSELGPRLTEYHEKVEGKTEELFAFVKELMPEDVREAFPKAAFCTELMHVNPNTAAIPLARFLAGIEDNLDEDDTIEGIGAALDKVTG